MRNKKEIMAEIQQKIICFEPENNLIVLSSSYEATEDEKRNRLAKYVCKLSKWEKQENNGEIREKKQKTKFHIHNTTG